MAHLEQFDHQSESHRQVDVGLGHVLVHALEENGHADRDEERQCENFQRGAPDNEIPDRFGVGENDGEGRDDSESNDEEIRREAHGGDDRIERENHVEEHDLEDGRAERIGYVAAGMLVLQLDHVVDFLHRFPEQEQPAGDENDIAPGERNTGEDRIGEVHQPISSGDESETRGQRDEQAEPAGLVTLVLGQARDDDGDDEHVVDAEDQLQTDEQGERGQRVECEGVGEKCGEVHPALVSARWRSVHQEEWGKADARRRLSPRAGPNTVCTALDSGSYLPA